MWQSGHVFILSYCYLLYILSSSQQYSGIIFNLPAVNSLWPSCFFSQIVKLWNVNGTPGEPYVTKGQPMNWTAHGAFMFLNIKKTWFSRKNVCFFISLKWHVSETFFFDSPLNNEHSDNTEIMACLLRVRIDRFSLYFLSEYSNFVWLKVGYPFYDQKYFFYVLALKEDKNTTSQ